MIRVGCWAARRELKHRMMVAVVLAGVVAGAGAQTVPGQVMAQFGPAPMTPLQVVNAMLVHEDDDSAHRDKYEFLSNERSDSTGGHMWTERVVETSKGRVRFLLAVDEKPLTAEEQKKERGRLASIVANPDAFEATEQSQKGDEAHARTMLDLLPKAFLFDHVRLEDGIWKMDFHPNPEFTPHGIQERVLYGMSGNVAIDAKAERLVHVEGVLPADLSIGFGLVATVRAGTHFGSDRADMGGHWRTVHVVTDVRGKAILFKSVAKESDITRSEFHYLDAGITIAQAVALVEQ